jgi:hypothetical protein
MPRRPSYWADTNPQIHISKLNQEVWMVLAGFLRSGRSGPQKTTKNLPNLWSSFLMHYRTHRRECVSAPPLNGLEQQRSQIYSATSPSLRSWPLPAWMRAREKQSYENEFNIFFPETHCVTYCREAGPDAAAIHRVLPHTVQHYHG